MQAFEFSHESRQCDDRRSGRAELGQVLIAREHLVHARLARQGDLFQRFLLQT